MSDLIDVDELRKIVNEEISSFMKKHQINPDLSKEESPVEVEKSAKLINVNSHIFLSTSSACFLLSDIQAWKLSGEYIYIALRNNSEYISLNPNDSKEWLEFWNEKKNALGD